MINKIYEVEKALDAECYQSALALALTIPDVFGKVLYPNLNVGDRYAKWFNEQAITRLMFMKTEHEHVEFTGEMCYKLRCKMLHEGHLDIAPILDEFYLYTSNKEDLLFSLYSMGENECIGKNIYTGDDVIIKSSTTNAIAMDLRMLCVAICGAAKDCYENSGKKALLDDNAVVFLKKPPLKEWL